MSHVKIGPEFFAKAKNDYADLRRAWVREILQNSIDATNCNNITLTIEPSKENQTKVTAHNDGDPMDEHTLTTKLLSLGSSGKNFNGTTGGFGKAKELLYLTHPSYQIRTGTHQVDGSGGEYELTQIPHHPGTTSTVTMDGNQTEPLIEAAQELAAQTQWHGTLIINDHVTPTNLRKGTPRKELAWAKIYTNKSQKNIAIIRINGLPMFTRYVSYDGTILIELIGNSNEILTSNRDGLTYSYREQLNEFITSLTVDKKSALRNQAPTYEIYPGTDRTTKPTTHEHHQPDITHTDLTDLINVTRTRIAASTHADGREPTATEPSINIGPTLIIKNTTGLETPAHYRPGPDQSSYAKKLTRAWAAILLKLHEILNRHDQFNIGLLIDEENIAEHEQGPYGRTYYINPTTIVKQRNNPNCKSLKNRYPGAWQARHTLIALALHEMVHATHKHHDDEYASKLTEYTDKALQHLNEITPLCRG